ncbi:MAG: hypothetical protein A2289_12060 [Deltaproteobacteria bacterium RIFOXYA12_FULL_58_15]|nr:MAG: hypothetical protein A2289_12060 [Deltaproteobacteria bacterium RIFOXYA12_FULL_58_15]
MATVALTNDGPLLAVRTPLSLALGTYLPVKLTNPSNQENLSTLGRVIDDARGQSGLHLALPSDDPKVASTLERWAGPTAIPRISKPAGSITPVTPGDATAAAAASVAATVIAPEQEDFREEQNLDHLVEDTSAGENLDHLVQESFEDENLDHLVEAVIPDTRAQASRAESCAKQLLTDAAAAELEGDHGRACALIQDAIDVFPVRAVELHLQLAQLAANKLGDFKLARANAAAALALAPEDPRTRRVVNTLQNQNRVSRIGEIPPPPGAKAAIQFGRRAWIAMGMFVVAVAAVSWVGWRFFATHGEAPSEVSRAELGDLPANGAKLHRGAFYVTIDMGKWQTLDQEKRSKLVARVARLGTEKFHTRRSIIVSGANKLLAVSQDGKITVYR